MSRDVVACLETRDNFESIYMSYRYIICQFRVFDISILLQSPETSTFTLTDANMILNFLIPEFIVKFFTFNTYCIYYLSCAS